MDDRVLQFRVGLLVLATALIAFFLVVYFGQLPFFARGEYVIHVEFREAPGVAVDTPVRKNGILIGRVDRVKLEDDRVLVSLGINVSYRVRTNEVCRISTGNLFGDAVLEFVKIDDFSQEPALISTGAFVQGEIAQDPLKVLMELQGVVVNLEDDAEKALRAVAAASGQVKTLAENLNTFIGTDGDEFRKLVGKSAQAMDSIDQAATTFHQLLGDEELQGDWHSGPAGASSNIIASKRHSARNSAAHRGGYWKLAEHGKADWHLGRKGTRYHWSLGRKHASDENRVGRNEQCWLSLSIKGRGLLENS